MRDFLSYEREREERTLEQNAREEAERLGISYVKPSVVEQLDFPIPDGVDPFWIAKESGARSAEGAPGAFLEYFVKGTEPEERSYDPVTEEGDEGEASTSSYLESPDL
jgi:hypothetical protein